LGLLIFGGADVWSAVVTWLVSLLGSLIIIFLSYRQVGILREKLITQLAKSEKQSQHQTALASLSAGFATTLIEEEICQELAKRLYEIKGYEYVAIYLVDEKSKKRGLKANVGDLGLPDSMELEPGKGLNEAALTTKKLQYTPDVSISPKYIPGIGSGSEVDVPIQFDRKVLGVIVIENSELDAFGADDFSLLTTAADQAALAILNTRLLASEKQRRRQAEILRNATMMFGSDLDLDHVLSRILSQLGEVVPFSSACIFLHKDEALIARAEKGLPLPDVILGKKFSAEDRLFQKVLAEKRPILIDDVQLSGEFSGWGGTHDIRSWMGVPLNAGGKIIGILTLDNRHKNIYDQEKADFALIFANQAAIAIQNAQLYNAARTSADQLMVLHQASREITSSSFDPEKTYSTIHEAAKQLMPCEAFVISILNEAENIIEGVYLFDKNGRTPAIKIPKDQGLSGYIIRNGEPLLVHDYLESKEIAALPVKHFGNHDHIRAFIAVPMKLGDKIVGMLSSQSYFPHNYTHQDQQMLEMLAAHAAIAIDNAHLFTQIQHLAITDSLTNIYNRRYFFDVANKEFARSIRYKKPLSIIMIDLDNYKEINDRYGHITGDKALKVISGIIADNIRETDILGRYGGDEFSILLPETNIEQAVDLAERLKNLVRNTMIDIDQVKFSNTISVGVSCIGNHTKDLSDLLLYADIALYDAKLNGRNRVCLQTTHEEIAQDNNNEGTTDD
jgi:diguanylate cyclase (GGDEF)-like protein